MNEAYLDRLAAVMYSAESGLDYSALDAESKAHLRDTMRQVMQEIGSIHWEHLAATKNQALRLINLIMSGIP